MISDEEDMTDIVIDRVPRMRSNLLEAVQELGKGFAKLIRLAELLPQSDRGTPEMTLEDWYHFGQVGRQMIWCRMYAVEISGRQDSLSLPNLTAYGSEEFEIVQWLFTCVATLYDLEDYASRTSWNLQIKNGERSPYRIAQMRQLIKKHQEATSRLIAWIEAMVHAGCLPSTELIAEES